MSGVRERCRICLKWKPAKSARTSNRKKTRRFCRTNEQIHETAFQAFVRLPVIYGLETVYERMKARESE